MAGKKYQVIALSVGGRNNKIFKSGEKVSASDFKEGEAEKRVADGHLKEVKNKVSVKDAVEAIEKAKNISEINELIDGDERDGVMKAYKVAFEKFEAEAKLHEENSHIKVVNAAKSINDLKVYFDGDFSENIKEAAGKKADELYIELINQMGHANDLTMYLDGDYSEAVKEAAKVKSESFEADAKKAQDVADIKAINALESEKGLKKYLDGDYSEAVKEAAKVKSEALKNTPEEGVE